MPLILVSVDRVCDLEPDEDQRPDGWSSASASTRRNFFIDSLRVQPVGASPRPTLRRPADPRAPDAHAAPARPATPHRGQAGHQLLGEIESLVFRQRHRVFEQFASAIGHGDSVAGVARLCHGVADPLHQPGPGRTKRPANSPRRLEGHATHDHLASSRQRSSPPARTSHLRGFQDFQIRCLCFCHAFATAHRFHRRCRR